MGFAFGCCCGIDCSPCCSDSPASATIDWPGGLTAKADCDGCDKIPSGEYVVAAETFYAPFGAACYWIDQIGSGDVYPDCGAGLMFGTDPASPGPEATFLVALIHDLVSGKCYLAVTVAVAITSSETVGGNTVNFLAGALYVSEQSDEAEHFCSGEFSLNLAATDPGYSRCGWAIALDRAELGRSVHDHRFHALLRRLRRHAAGLGNHNLLNCRQKDWGQKNNPLPIPSYFSVPNFSVYLIPTPECFFELIGAAGSSYLHRCRNCGRPHASPHDPERDSPRLRRAGSALALPSLARRVLNFVRSLPPHLAAGAPLATQEQIDARLAICHSCEHFTGTNCAQCGCRCNGSRKFFNALAWADKACPIGRWK